MSSNIPTPHINAPEGAFADQGQQNTGAVDHNVRGIQGYTGSYHGKKVSVMASGMGCPSIGIYSYELFNFYGVSNIIRIGSAGAISPKLRLKDIVIGMSAYTNSGYVSSFGFHGNAAPCCSYELLARAMAYAEKLPCNVVCGPLFSSDAFYSETAQTELLSGLGVLAVEMEAAALYINAARAGKNALAVCSISDSLVTGESLPAEERQIGFRNMMELGLSLI